MTSAVATGFATHAYAASKAGLIGLTDRPHPRDGSRLRDGQDSVQCHLPRADRDADEPARAGRRGDPRPAPGAPALTGDFGKPEDVAQAALYLATAPVTNGAVLTVDGGWIAR
jgi:NAD(P)-dependent dehydrogenase (short-subunit alcohol dehydrogenase family)